MLDDLFIWWCIAMHVLLWSSTLLSISIRQPIKEFGLWNVEQTKDDFNWRFQILFVLEIWSSNYELQIMNFRMTLVVSYYICCCSQCAKNLHWRCFNESSYEDHDTKCGFHNMNLVAYDVVLISWDLMETVHLNLKWIIFSIITKDYTLRKQRSWLCSWFTWLPQ